MYCYYEIKSKLDTGNTVTVEADFIEGNLDDNKKFVKTGIFKAVGLFFEKNPVEQDEINQKLLEMLNTAKEDRGIYNG